MFCGRDLWWTIPLHIFHWSCWDTLWIPNDTQKSTISTLAVKLNVSAIYYPQVDCHTFYDHKTMWNTDPLPLMFTFLYIKFNWKKGACHLCCSLLKIRTPLRQLHSVVGVQNSVNKISIPVDKISTSVNKRSINCLRVCLSVRLSIRPSVCALLCLTIASLTNLFVCL